MTVVKESRYDNIMILFHWFFGASCFSSRKCIDTDVAPVQSKVKI